MKNILLFVLLTIALSSCIDHSCEVTKQGHAKLVGYKVAKHSHMAFQILETNTIQDVGSMGGRREPSIPIGTVIDCNYTIDTCSGYIQSNICGSCYAKQPQNRNSRRVNFPF